MSMTSDKICLEGGESENVSETITLAEKAKKIGFSANEIAELDRLYAARKKVRK